MKFINLFNIKNNVNFFVLNILEKKKRWGRVDTSFIVYFCYKTLVIIDPIQIFLNLKKIVWVIYLVAQNQSVSLIFFNKTSKFLFEKEFRRGVKNLAILLVNKLFGFLTSFSFFVERIKLLKKNKITNYTQIRYPSLIFLTKKCWKSYSGIFKICLTLRILSIKSLHYSDTELNAGYSVVISDCGIVYWLFKYIYKINNKFVIKW